MEIKKNKEVQPNFVNRISVETRITGETETQHDMRIDGFYEGAIKTTGRLVIGETGRYKGTVQCKYLDVWGEFAGSVSASEVVTFMTGAIFEGEVHTEKLMMELGVIFNGTCVMHDSGKSTPSLRPE
ncbi:MAG: polymer-forming cytoskeletal protein [Prevotellaceae bacterium]|nr:polymer-forming cytoskeletal protein [Prevotellaceae bacterium]